MDSASGGDSGKGDTGKGEKGNSGKGAGKPGDWECLHCGDSQFAKNTVCRKCGAAKDGTGGNPAKGKSGKGDSGKGAGQCGDFKRGNCTRGDSCRFSHTQEGPGGGKAGDWTCTLCGELQFARNKECRKCGGSRDGDPGHIPLASQGPGIEALKGSTPFFEYSPAFTGARSGYVFKLDHMGLGYYLDPTQTLLPKVKEQLPHTLREIPMREERLKVDPTSGAGVALEPCDFGFHVTGVDAEPGQNLQAGDVIVAVEGRMFVGISGDQMKASFLKRRADGARLAVVRLEEAKEMSTKDASIIEGWDARNGCKYFFSKRSGLSAWSIEELKKKEAPKAAEEEAPKAPVDLQHFLTHGFGQPLESEQDRKQKKRKKDNTGELTKDISDLARAEQGRINDWNEGGRGGYTDAFFAKYKNAHAFPAKEKPVDKRLKGSVGPGRGCDHLKAWTGSKNSFN